MANIYPNFWTLPGVVEIVSERKGADADGAVRELTVGEEEDRISAHHKQKHMVEVPLVNDVPGK